MLLLNILFVTFMVPYACYWLYRIWLFTGKVKPNNLILRLEKVVNKLPFVFAASLIAYTFFRTMIETSLIAIFGGVWFITLVFVGSMYLVFNLDKIFGSEGTN